MNTNEIDRLLDPTPLPLEMGYERLGSGVLHIACRTDLHGCTGAMFEWWFRSRPMTQQYVWWHPVDHVFSDWSEGQPDTHVGSIHKVEERFTGQPAEKLLIQFRDPAEFFSADALAKAKSAGVINGLVCGRGGHGWDAPRDPAGRILGTRLYHLARDTAWGTALRSHFFLGHDLPHAGKQPSEIEQMIPDVMGPALLAHCYNEFTFLSRFLPSLYAAENKDKHEVQLPW